MAYGMKWEFLFQPRTSPFMCYVILQVALEVNCLVIYHPFFFFKASFPYI